MSQDTETFIIIINIHCEFEWEYAKEMNKLKHIRKTVFFFII